MYCTPGLIQGLNRLVFDHATGKPKGFGFCEYRDADTAASALRNLQGVEVGGRGLRLDFADTDDAPPSKRFRGPGGGPAGPGMLPPQQAIGGGPTPPAPAPLAGPPAGGYAIPPPPVGSTGPRPLPQGVPVEAGKTAVDKITETIGTMPPGQLLDIMSQMKVRAQPPPLNH